MQSSIGGPRAKYDRLPALAAELVRLKVDVIITQGTPAALVAKQVTTTIVMAMVGNPVETRIVASIARPRTTIPNFSSPQTTPQ